MKNLWFLLVFILTSPLQAQTVVPLSSVDFSKVTREKRSLIHAESKYRVWLINGFCDESKHQVNVTKADVLGNLLYYKAEFPKLLAKLEGLVNELKPGFFVENADFYPIDLNLSLDGNEECYNASAEGSTIELPAQAKDEYVRAVFDLLYHEIGHTVSFFNGKDLNIFDETIADAFSLLLLDPFGVFYLGIKEDREDWRRQIELGMRDPHALAAELEIEYSDIPLWMNENRLKFKCSSDHYYRDMRSLIPLSDAFAGGGESYIVSCALHSYLYKLGMLQGREKILKNLVRAYLNRPQLFNEISLPFILNVIYPDVTHEILDPSLRRLSLKPAGVNVKTYFEPFTDETGVHYRLHWDHPYLRKDLGIVAFKNTLGDAIASFSLISMRNSAVLTPQDLETCQMNRLLCFCPEDKNDLGIQLAWLGRDNVRAQEKTVELPINPKGCFELGVPENLKTEVEN